MTAGTKQRNTFKNQRFCSQKPRARTKYTKNNLTVLVLLLEVYAVCTEK